MSILFYSLLLWLWDNRSFETIRAANRAKIEAQVAFEQGDYKTAIENYKIVTESSVFAGANVRLNLAHAYFKNQDFKNARLQYSRLLKVSDQKILSKAHTQLGIIAVYETDTLLALNELEKALLNDPENNTARTDYEVIRSHFKGQMPPPKSNVPQKPKEQAQQNVAQATAEVQKTEERKNTLTRLKELGMTEAQALAILDAMKANEIQYLQQKRPTQAPDKTKGRW